MYDMLRAGLSNAVPFARLVGVELVDLADGSASARLESRPDLLNHIGTVHAGALFAVAETASGAAVAGAFADMIGAIRPVAAEARIAYLKLARGTVTCSAETSEPGEQLRRRLRDEQKVVFDVTVTIDDDQGQRVATMAVSWNVRLTGTPAVAEPAAA